MRKVMYFLFSEDKRKKMKNSCNHLNIKFLYLKAVNVGNKCFCFLCGGELPGNLVMKSLRKANNLDKLNVSANSSLKENFKS